MNEHEAEMLEQFVKAVEGKTVEEKCEEILKGYFDTGTSGTQQMELPFDEMEPKTTPLDPKTMKEIWPSSDAFRFGWTGFQPHQRLTDNVTVHGQIMGAMNLEVKQPRMHESYYAVWDDLMFVGGPWDGERRSIALPGDYQNNDGAVFHDVAVCRFELSMRAYSPNDPVPDPISNTGLLNFTAHYQLFRPRGKHALFVLLNNDEWHAWKQGQKWTAAAQTTVPNPSEQASPTPSGPFPVEQAPSTVDAEMNEHRARMGKMMEPHFKDMSVTPDEVKLTINKNTHALSVPKEGENEDELVIKVTRKETK